MLFRIDETYTPDEPKLDRRRTTAEFESDKTGLELLAHGLSTLGYCQEFMDNVIEEAATDLDERIIDQAHLDGLEHLYVVDNGQYDWTIEPIKVTKDTMSLAGPTTGAAPGPAEQIFDIISLDGPCSVEYILDNLYVPHYTNDHTFDTNRVISYRSVIGVDPTSPEEIYMVIWSGRPEPTIDEIKQQFVALYLTD